MRAPRIVILAFFVASSLFLLGRALTSPAQSRPATLPTSQARSHKSLWGMMYYNTPFSLFPPNAAISLTDDNSTSFAARPAAFGPKLAEKGLSGQLWVGSGFAEDSIDGEGELGCSDLPGWDGSSNPMKNSFRSVTLPRVTTANRGPGGADNDMLLDRDNRDAIAKSKADAGSVPDDGTDDYLHRGYIRDTTSASPPHADIQSLQETAEIEGKVALLMRGGCGFLEKVMWAQRRGAIAVIVGDNQKGGPLIQMFAHGQDVDNVTIPSVFTARTTAQLLSSLTQPGSFIEDLIDDNGNPVLKVQSGLRGKKYQEDESSVRGHTASSHTIPRSSGSKKSSGSNAGSSTSKTNRSNWVARMFGWTQPARTAADNARSWAPVEGWSEDMTVTPDGDDDGFIIGVHDWRDPDLVEHGRSSKPGTVEDGASSGNGEADEEPGLMSKLFGTRNQNDATSGDYAGTDTHDSPEDPETKPHEGLWVTITPTGSASPFFDTLLVLVVSPLITLTVVYALLLLRARIRRRRWRAPKSVVERLPVRTYHTVATSSPASRLPSPSSASPTTPLLQRDHSRSRPRSRTTTGVLESENLMPPSEAVPTPRSRSRARGRTEREKGAGGFSAEWKKYMGRQVECVVCLEEYVDGVSRVMSLPCGHEFHEDCM